MKKSQKLSEIWHFNFDTWLNTIQNIRNSSDSGYRHVNRFDSRAMKVNLSDLQGQNSSDSGYGHMKRFDSKAMKENLSDLQGQNSSDSE